MPFSPLDMSSRAAAFGAALGSNATRAEKVEHLPPPTPFSSTSALTLLAVVIVAIVALSLTAHRCHKGKMKRRRIERAQEEYERDRRSPVPARAKPDAGRCTIARPVQAPASSGKPDAATGAPPTTTLAEREEGAGGALEAVAVS